MKSRLFEFVKTKELKERRNISNKEICEETGLTRNTVAAWLSQEPFSRIEITSALKLAEWAGCKWHELVEVIEVSEN